MIDIKDIIECKDQAKLEEYKMLTLDELDQVNEKIESIKSMAKVEKVYAPARMYNNLKTRKRLLGRMVTKIQARISLLKREKSARFEVFFVVAAKERLDRETYQQIVDDTKKMIG